MISGGSGIPQCLTVLNLSCHHCILNRDKRLVGVISIGDLAKGGEEQITGETIKDIAAAPPAQAA
jgi:hypothetical protein